jgi:hypothetical protein
MGYGDLYNFCQTQSPHIRRNLIRDKVLELAGVPKISPVKTSLDTASCRGFYLSARNTNHRLVQQLGCHVIVLARELNRCWERFVFVKELMHIFDDPSQATDSGATFDRVLSELLLPSAPQWSPQMLSELGCFWMALGVLCPESLRLAFQSERERGQIDDYSIALKLRIPEMYVPALFFEDFLERIKPYRI